MCIDALLNAESAPILNIAFNVMVIFSYMSISVFLNASVFFSSMNPQEIIQILQVNHVSSNAHRDSIVVFIHSKQMFIYVKNAQAPAKHVKMKDNACLVLNPSSFVAGFCP